MEWGYKGYRGATTQTYKKLYGYKNLLAWQAADDLATYVHEIVLSFPPRYFKLADQMCERWSLIKGEKLTELVRLYGDATWFLEQLIKGLRAKRREDNWDRSMGIKEEEASYVATDADIPFTLPDEFV